MENPDGTPVKESRSIQPMRMPFTPRLNGVPQHGTPNGNTQETQGMYRSCLYSHIFSETRGLVHVLTLIHLYTLILSPELGHIHPPIEVHILSHA